MSARRKGDARHIGYSDGAAARYAIACGAFDTLRASVRIADREAIDRTLPLARQRDLGLIANAAWRYAKRPEVAYHRPDRDRL